MIPVQIITHGNMLGYMGTIPLGLLHTKVTLSLPPDLEQLQPWLEEESKTVNGIAHFVQKSIGTDEPWHLGCIIIALYYQEPEQEPIFRPIAHQEESGEVTYGLLETNDAATWVPVDGLQRLLGMFKALSRMIWQKESLLRNPIPTIFLPISNSSVLQELIIRMHKSARTVTRSETIRTSTEDTYSTYAGWLKGDDTPTHPAILPEKLVNWKSNTITSRLRQFTTLSTLYDSAAILDQALGKLFFPEPEERDKRYLQIYELWNLLLKNFTPYQEALSGPPDRLPGLREKFLCMRPTGQLILINVIALALEKQVSLGDVIERLKSIPWEMNNPIWQGVIIVEGRVNGRAAATLFTAKLVAYLIGIPMSDYELNALQIFYERRKEALPPPIFKPLEYLNNQTDQEAITHPEVK